MTQEEKQKQEIEQLIASEIGYFYYYRIENGTVKEQVAEASKEIKAIRITKIEFDGKDIHITTERPGVLIGRKGKDINDLTAYLHTKVVFETLHIVEERVLQKLYSFQYYLGLDDEGIFGQ